MGSLDPMMGATRRPLQECMAVGHLVNPRRMLPTWTYPPWVGHPNVKKPGQYIIYFESFCSLEYLTNILGENRYLIIFFSANLSFPHQTFHGFGQVHHVQAVLEGGARITGAN